jgi:hypothetical protein
VVYKVLGDFKSSGQAGDKCNQSLAVRLSGGEEFQHVLGLYPMSNVAEDMANPQLRLFIQYLATRIPRRW